MSFIRMSSVLVQTGAKNGLFLGTSSSQTSSYPASYSLFNNWAPTQLRLHSGTMPTESSASTYAGYGTTFQSASVLITFEGFGGATYEGDEIIISNTKVYWRSKTVKTATAAASGQASWFSVFHAYTGNTSHYLNANGHWLMGDVTGPGGGGALEVDDVNIVSGQSYQLKNYSFVLPRAWTIA